MFVKLAPGGKSGGYPQVSWASAGRGKGGICPIPWKIKKLEKNTWNERKNTIFHAKYHDIRSIVCLLPEELLTFCFYLQ